jgi:YVTN family beta-propeller protein
MRRIVAAIAWFFACSAIAAPFAYVPFTGGVNVFDTETNARIWQIPMPNAAPVGVAIARDGRRAYFGDVLSDQVYVVDTGNQSVIRRLTAGTGPAALALNADGTRLAVGAAGTLLVAGSTVRLVDTATGQVLATAESGSRPAALSFSADGTRLYVANGESHTVTVHDASTLEMLASIPVPLGPVSLALHPAGNRLYVGHIGTLLEQVSVVSVVDLESNSVAATIPLGIRPALVLLDPTGSRLYVGNVESDSISIVDTATHAVLANIPVRQSPTGLDLHPDGKRLYVPTHGGPLSVVDVVNRKVSAEVSNPKFITLGRFIAPSPDTGDAKNPAWLSGLWWNPDESGWGASVTQRGGTLFIALFTYDRAGAPKWYVASSCQLGGRFCSGRLYQTSGPRFFGAPFNPSAAAVKDVGFAGLNFTDNDNAALSYFTGNESRTVAVTRQRIAAGEAPGVNYTDLWWNPAESGWGLSVTQQGRVMFLAWFVYDAAGNPVWYVASNCAVNAAANGCTGKLYRTTGPAAAETFDPARVRVIEAGSVTLSFSDGNNGMLSYTADGQSGSKAITRQLF